MAPKLYIISGSPSCRSVLLCAKVLELDLELVDVDFFGFEHLKEDYLSKNPQHTLPLLEDEDGFLLADSHAIMGYLVNKYGKDDSLYPIKDFKLRAVIDHRLHFDSCSLLIKGLQISQPLLFHKILPPEENIKVLREAFQIVDSLLEKNQTKYIAGDKLTIADFSMITSVTSWDVFTPYSEFPYLKAYIERIQQQPWYEVNKEGLNFVTKKVKDTLSAIKNK